MKFVIVVCVVLVAVVAASTGNGRSGCRDESEVGQTYPHHFDPSKYWLCETLGESAKEVDCPKDMAYMHLLKECIPWSSWIWKKPEFPPTLAEEK